MKKIRSLGNIVIGIIVTIILLYFIAFISLRGTEYRYLIDYHIWKHIIRAENGDVDEQMFLADDMYMDKNYHKAEYWWLKAVNSGEILAQQYLANMYADVTEMKNYKEAVKRWRIAANKGYHESQYRLGIAYINGDLGLPRDFNRGIKWLILASDRYVPAIEALKSLGYY